ncbi:hypothetical protein TNCV_3784431 [Trichonephila clavipes]|nr:hypothetical protein TNCV_3784431 [Trichonephila clavipes]
MALSVYSFSHMARGGGKQMGCEEAQNIIILRAGRRCEKDAVQPLSIYCTDSPTNFRFSSQVSRSIDMVAMPPKMIVNRVAKSTNVVDWSASRRIRGTLPPQVPSINLKQFIGIYANRNITRLISNAMYLRGAEAWGMKRPRHLIVIQN